MNHITITDEFRAGLQSLYDVSKALPEVCERFPELPQCSSDLFCVKNDSFLAIRTGDLVITLEPTERLAELIAAARAWKSKGDIVEKVREVGNERVCV
jgi:hypothetical protein